MDTSTKIELTTNIVKTLDTATPANENDPNGPISEAVLEVVDSSTVSDLSRIARSWATLPCHIRLAIMTLVDQG
jgi:hypothetical protein